MLHRTDALSLDSREPAHIAIARHAYYASRDWLEYLETRIMRTDSGLAWLVRVKRIGYR
jgi:hypothetical protein